jgi:hypothetical protein
MEQFSMWVVLGFFSVVALTTGWSLFGDRLKENDWVLLTGSLVVLCWKSRTTKLPNGRKISVTKIPDWDWLRIMIVHPVTGERSFVPLVELMTACGGGVTTSYKKYDIVFLSEGQYSPETEKFVLEHELGHIRGNHVFRTIDAGLTEAVQKFEVEADAYAASVVGAKQAYYALLEIREKHIRDFLAVEKNGIDFQARVEVMRARVKHIDSWATV